jgi:hypothetical protein
MLMKSPFLLMYLVLVSITSCQKETDCKGIISECLSAKIEEFKKSNESKAIYRFTLDGRDFYWFNTDALSIDGSEDIYREDCLLACTLCSECLPPPCAADFPNERSGWHLFWKK